MFECFFPDYERNSAYEIEYEKLYDEGFRGIIFDIDNTLVPHGAAADRRAKELFQRLHGIGFKTLLLSNNKEPRVKSFAGQVNSLYIFKAGKPRKAGYQKAMEQMGTNVQNTLFVGDQIFTDIWGAKAADIATFLTRPIHPREEIQIVLKRIPEKLVLYFYHKKHKTERRVKSFSKARSKGFFAKKN